jgi:hypothetical protein
LNAVCATSVRRALISGTPYLESTTKVNNTPYAVCSIDMQQPCAAVAPVDALAEYRFQGCSSLFAEDRRSIAQGVVTCPWVVVRAS